MNRTSNKKQPKTQLYVEKLLPSSSQQLLAEARTISKLYRAKLCIVVWLIVDTFTLVFVLVFGLRVWRV